MNQTSSSSAQQQQQHQQQHQHPPASYSHQPQQHHHHPLSGPPPGPGLSSSPSPYPPQQQQHQHYAQAALSSATAPPLPPTQHMNDPLQQQQQQQQVPSPSHSDGTNANGQRKRQKWPPGSRCVANLTPEQLEKKRANDREAQRAIRVRTKNTIETLEKRIKDLEGQQPYQELKRVEQERDAALAECEELKRRLAAVAGIVGSREGELGVTGLSELAALTAQQSPLPPITATPAQSHQYPTQAQPASTNGHYDSPAQQHHLHPELRSPHSSSHTDSPSQARFPPTERKWGQGIQEQQHPSPNGVTYDQRAPQAQMHTQPNGNGDRLGLNFVLDRHHQHSPVLHNRHHTPDSISNRALTPHHQPPWTRVPPNLAPTCPLDSLLGDFILRQRALLATGMSTTAVLGPEYPSFDGLLGSTPHDMTTHPVSSLLTQIISKFPDISLLPERVGVLYVMFLLLRWLICPCQRCYERLPTWMQPLQSEIEILRPRWLDNIPWAVIRSTVTHAKTPGTRVKFDDFFVSYTITLSLNWPYPPHTVLIQTPAENSGGSGSKIEMNPVFEAHLRELGNWSLGSDFVRQFPEIVDGSVRIEDRGGLVGSSQHTSPEGAAT